ncbi:hypothetical protein BsWGS_11653 [Bradybaena similaris]
MSKTSLDKEGAGFGLEGDVSQESVGEAKEGTAAKGTPPKKKPKFIGPPRPYHRDGMGGYKVPPGGRPLTVYDIPGPGPDSYYPDYGPVVKKYPGWTFGEKEAMKPKTDLPGPNKYNTAGDMKWGKCKTVTLKDRIPPLSGKRSFPGPAAYSIKRSISCGPHYSMRLKPKSLLEPGLVSKLALHPDPVTPGPSYNLPSEEWLRKPQSFGIKHKEMKPAKIPGPEKYFCRPNLEGPKWIIGELKKINRFPRPHPGPERYTLKSTIGEAPKYSMAGRLPVISKSSTPGPDVYNSAGIRLDEPGYTMKYRWFESRPEKRPGPYSYSDEQIRKKTPAYTMSIRGKPSYPSSIYSNFRMEGPAPNQYNVPRDPLQQGKTISIKLKDSVQEGVPGPGDYHNTDHINANQRRAPAYSLGQRFSTKFEVGPGPGQYDVKFQDYKPGKTFGIKCEKKAKAYGPSTALYPVDISKVCGSCDFIPGATLKSRHTPHQYLGIKDSSRIPFTPKDAPRPPLLG